MRFVNPDTTRLELPNGEWVEVKNELPSIEEKRYRSAGFKRVRMDKTNADTVSDVEMDWVELAFARIVAYVVDWNVKDANGNKVKYTIDAVRRLVSEDFDVLNKAVEAHEEAKAAEKKAQSGTPPGATSLSAVSS